MALHVPPMAGSWHGNLHLRETMLPVLNNAGVDLMISGHIHGYAYREPCEEMKFPNFINDNDSVALVTVDSDGIHVSVSGKTNKSFDIVR